MDLSRLSSKEEEKKTIEKSSDLKVEKVISHGETAEKKSRVWWPWP